MASLSDSNNSYALWATDASADNYWQKMWTLQRDEVSQRLAVEHQETTARKDLQGIGARERRMRGKNPAYTSAAALPAAAPVIPPVVPMMNNSNPVHSAPPVTMPPPSALTLEEIEVMRARLVAMSDAEQASVVDWVQVRCPSAITTGMDGVATMDPVLLDRAVYKDLMDYLQTIEFNPLAIAAPPQFQPQPGPAFPAHDAQTEQVWSTGYLSGTPRAGPRPHGTAPLMDNPAMMQPLFQPAPPMAPPPMAASALAPRPAMQTVNQMQPLMDANALALASQQGTQGAATQFVEPYDEYTDALVAMEDRKELANRIARLPDMQKKLVLAEVSAFCPQAIQAMSPALAAIDTGLLDHELFLRVVGLVQSLQDQGATDTQQEAGRSMRRQGQREVFIARERARERERALDIELERQAREEEIKRDLERDLIMVRVEAEQERHNRWYQNIEERRRDMMQREELYTDMLTNQDREMQMLQVQQDHANDASDPERVELREQLQEVVSILNDADKLAFADFVVQVQPDAVDGDAVRTAAFSKYNLTLALQYALQLQNTSVDRQRQLDAQLMGDLPPRPSSGGREAAPPAGGTTRDAIVATRLPITNRINTLPHSKQRLVCKWLLQHAPEAIQTQTDPATGKVSKLIETAKIKNDDLVRQLAAYVDEICQ